MVTTREACPICGAPASCDHHPRTHVWSCPFCGEIVANVLYPCPDCGDPMPGVAEKPRWQEIRPGFLVKAVDPEIVAQMPSRQSLWSWIKSILGFTPD